MDAPIALQALDLSHSYQGRPALQEISFAVKKGEIFGLVGPDGAGKTTLLKIAVGLLKPSAGQIKVQRGPGFGYIPQRFSLYRDLTVEENINFFGRIYGLKNFQARKNQLLDSVDLGRFKNRLADKLSGGMKQKLALCCALIHEPTTLVLDEPTTGVDPVSRREFWGVIFELQKGGLTVLAATPYMDEAEQFDRVALLHSGRFLRLGSTAEIKSSVKGSVFQMRCGAPYQARQVLRQLPFVEEVELFGDSVHLFVAQVSDDILQRCRAAVEASGQNVHSLRQVEYSIEDVFIRLASSEAMAS